MTGDARRRPDFDVSYDKRQDYVHAMWRKRGDLQLHQIGRGAETFTCYRCGYAVKSHLQVIKKDNWDYRMCYKCYTRVIEDGMEKDT